MHREGCFSTWVCVVKNCEKRRTRNNTFPWQAMESDSTQNDFFGQCQAICNAQCYCHLKGTLLQMMPINLKPVCHGFFSLLGFFFYFSFTFLNSKTNVKFKNSIKVAQMDHYWTLLLSLVQL